jgi:hypothetical protein
MKGVTEVYVMEIVPAAAASWAKAMSGLNDN